MKILVITANYYPEISNSLRLSAQKSLLDYEVKYFTAPGVFEIPLIISKYIDEFDGFVALGCVIKGETSHFDLISQSVTDGLMNLSINFKKPIGNGILTCINKEQALERLNKGSEAANAVTKVLLNVPIK